MLPIGVGLGWRPETAWMVDRTATLAFTEVIAETIDPRRPPGALMALVERGLPVIAHGISLDLGGTSPLDRARIQHLADVARTLRSPLVSEHVAFRRAGDLASPHFLPVPRTRAQLALMIDRVRRAADAMPVPLALENPAAPFVWPGEQLAAADFLAELAHATGAPLLLDVANLHADRVNHGLDVDAFLDRLPLDRVAYLHVAGGAHVDALYRDTHAHPVSPPVLALLARVLARTGPRPTLLERDANFGPRAALAAELALLSETLGPVPAPVPDLATLHHALLATLLTDAPPPPGFAPSHLAETRAILARKTR